MAAPQETMHCLKLDGEYKTQKITINGHVVTTCLAIGTGVPYTGDSASRYQTTITLLTISGQKVNTAFFELVVLVYPAFEVVIFTGTIRITTIAIVTVAQCLMAFSLLTLGSISAVEMTGQLLIL